MNFQYFLLLVSAIVFLFSSSFASGVENAFGFLFWVNLIILLPIIFIWTILQFVALGSLFSSPAGMVIAPLISFVGWWLLAVYGINTLLCFFIGNNVEGATSFLALPIYTQIAIVLFITIAILSPKLKRQKQAEFTYTHSHTKQQNDEVIIDAEIVEHTVPLEHKK